MTDPTRTCACGCGTPVTNKWARGHSARGEGGYRGEAEPARVTALPPPDDPWWEEDGGGPHMDIGQLDPEPDDTGIRDTGPANVAEPTGPEPRGPGLPDPPPLHGGKQWKRGSPKAAPRKITKVTAGVRNDIDAKISFTLEIPGRVWQARDPLCGGMFVQQRPEISAALTEIVCQSPDLIAWFAGGGGQFMLWLNLAAACWPVATVAMAHHVYHSIEAGEPDQASDQTRYAA